MYSFHGRGTLNGTIAHEGLARLAQMSADELGIKLNRFAMRGVLSDSSYVQFEGDGGTACSIWVSPQGTLIRQWSSATFKMPRSSANCSAGC